LLWEDELAREEQERTLMANEGTASELIRKEETKLNGMLQVVLEACRANVEISKNITQNRRAYIWSKARKILFDYLRVQVIQARCRDNLRVNPRDQAAMCALGYSLLRSQDYAEAVSYLHRAAKNGKTDGKFWRLYAIAQLRYWEKACTGGTEGLEAVYRSFARATRYIENTVSEDVILGMIKNHIYFRSYDGAKSILSQLDFFSMERLDAYQVDLHLCKATLSYTSNSFYDCIGHIESLLNMLVSHATFESVNVGFAPSAEHLLFLIGFILKKINQLQEGFIYFYAAYTGMKERHTAKTSTPATVIHSIGLTHEDLQSQYVGTDYGHWYNIWITWKVSIFSIIVP
jgi:tetratricopeptide (TPR) repeat protein